MAIKLKRAYEPPAASDGVRYLVDRLWPRGVKKEALKVKAWLKQVAPSDSLRRWSGHDPAKWDEFRRRYFEELDSNREAWEPLLAAARRGTVTLVYSAHDTAHNNAVALKQYLDAHSRRRRASPVGQRARGRRAVSANAEHASY